MALERFSEHNSAFTLIMKCLGKCDGSYETHNAGEAMSQTGEGKCFEKCKRCPYELCFAS